MSRPPTPPPSFEDLFLTAVRKGEVSSVNEILEKRHEIDLNINCKDKDGMSSLNIAITEGNLVVIYPLLESNVRIGDCMLRAVDNDFVEAVRLLCEYAKERPSKKERMAIIDCHSANDDFHPDVTPIVLASQRNNFSMIKMLVEVGARIPELTAATFETAARDSLQQSVGSLELYKGLASDAYVVLSSDDPINRCFTLCSNLRRLSEIEIEFKMSYLELVDKMEHCSHELIGQARSTEEILTILTTHEAIPSRESKKHYHDNAKDDSNDRSPLPTISRAIELEQRKFIASPNCQQAVISQFYRRLIYLRDRHWVYRMLFFILMLLLHPFLALLYLYIPKKKIKDFVSIPYIKFILYIGSDLLLVACLTMEAVLDEGAAYEPTLQKPYKIVVCIWIFGLAIFEINVMRSRDAKKLIIQWRHIRDIFIVICFGYAVIFDAIAVSMVNNSTTDSTEEPIVREQRDTRQSEAAYISQPSDYSMSMSQPWEWNTTNTSHGVIEGQYRVFVNTYAAKRRAAGAGRAAGGLAGGSKTRFSEDRVDVGGVLDRMWNHPQLIARALFAVATVVSISRIFPYLVVSDVVGPLKISLGSMVQKTSHFFLVVILVLMSFAVGMTYIYAYYNKTGKLSCDALPTTDKTCKTGEFNNLLTSTITLYWSTFGLNAMEVLTLPPNAKMLQTAGLLMYALFYVFVVVVLLNALIAVMSEVYSEVEENADEEWKFSCTAMWMGFMEDSNPLPPPYNLLPSYENMASMCKRLIQPYRWKTDREKLMASSKQTERDLTRTFLRESKKRLDEQSRERRYKKIMSLLVDRYVTDKTSGESSTTADVTTSDVRGLKNDLIALRYETFLKMCKTHDYLVRVAEECLGIHGQSKCTNDIFARTDVIEDVVQQHAKSVLEFQTTLHDTISQLPPPPTPPPEPDPEPEPSSKILKLIKYYDNGGSKLEHVEESQFWGFETGVDENLLRKRLERSPDESQPSGSSVEFSPLGKRLGELSPDEILLRRSFEQYPDELRRSGASAEFSLLEKRPSDLGQDENMLRRRFERSPDESQPSGASVEFSLFGKRHSELSPDGSHPSPISSESEKHFRASSDGSQKSGETVSLEYLERQQKVSPEGFRRSTESLGSLGSTATIAVDERSSAESVRRRDCQHKH